MTDLAWLYERLRQNRAALRQAIADTPAAASSREETGARGRAPGDRVFDLVSGEEGIVVTSTRENLVIPVADR